MHKYLYSTNLLGLTLKRLGSPDKCYPPNGKPSTEEWKIINETIVHSIPSAYRKVEIRDETAVGSEVLSPSYVEVECDDLDIRYKTDY